MAFPPFSAISLLQAAHARNTPPPWWHLEEGAEGAEGSGRQGGWGWLVGLAAGWWQGEPSALFVRTEKEWTP